MRPAGSGRQGTCGFSEVFTLSVPHVGAPGFGGYWSFRDTPRSTPTGDEASPGHPDTQPLGCNPHTQASTQHPIRKARHDGHHHYCGHQNHTGRLRRPTPAEFGRRARTVRTAFRRRGRNVRRRRRAGGVLWLLDPCVPAEDGRGILARARRAEPVCAAPGRGASTDGRPNIGRRRNGGDGHGLLDTGPRVLPVRGRGPRYPGSAVRRSRQHPPRRTGQGRGLVHRIPFLQVGGAPRRGTRPMG